MGRFSQRHIFLAGGAVMAVLFLIVFGVLMSQRGSAEAAFKRLLSADTFHTVSELSINLPPRFRGVDRPFTLVTIALDGDVARHTDRTPEFSGQISLEARGRGNIFFADGQAMVLRDQVFFNLDNLPVFLNPSGSLVKRWTKVDASLLTTQNPEAVLAAFDSLASAMKRDGSEKLAGRNLSRYRLTLTEDEERILADVLRRGASGNVGLDVFARLLDANVAREFTVLIDARKEEVRQVRAHFVRPFDPSRGSGQAAQGKPQEFDFAKLTLTFSDYEKSVLTQVPESKLFVQPRVFAKMFGGGAVEEVKVEEKESNE